MAAEIMAVYITAKPYYSAVFVDLLYARRHAGEGYKINEPVELEKLMNSGRNQM